VELVLINKTLIALVQPIRQRLYMPAHLTKN